MEYPRHTQELYTRLAHLNKKVGFDNLQYFLSIEQLDVIYNRGREILNSYSYYSDGPLDVSYDFDLIILKEDGVVLELYPHELSGWDEIISLHEEVVSLYYDIEDESGGILSYNLPTLKELQVESDFKWTYGNITSVLEVDIFSAILNDMDTKIERLKQQHLSYDRYEHESEKFWSHYNTLIDLHKVDVSFTSQNCYFMNDNGQTKTDAVLKMYSFTEDEIKVIRQFEFFLKKKIEQSLQQ
jgi:hypothetical protein